MSRLATLVERGLMGLYGVVWRAARPLLRRHKRLSDGFDMRLVPDGWSAEADIWVQAASGGEAYLAWEWLKAVLADGDDVGGNATYLYDAAAGPLRILLTSCTRQGWDVLQEAAAWAKAEAAQRGAKLSVTVQFFPLDEPSLMRRAVKMVAPRVVVLLETELWPALMLGCREACVPVMVLNGRMSPKSFGAYFAMQGFWRSMAPRRVAAISADDAMRFSMVFDMKAEVVPNMKFDRLGLSVGKKSTIQDAKCAFVGSLLPRGPVALLGSVREEEEPLLVAAVCQLQGKMSSTCQYSLIIAPRHMHRVSAWQERLRRVGVPTVLRSKLGSVVNEVRETGHKSNPPVIIWDTFGELDALYGLVHAVFVGGSLMPLGGQNFLEPLAKGLVPCVGPYLNNFAWVEPESLEAAGLLHVVRTDVELADYLYGALQEAHVDGVGSLSGAETVKERFHAWLAPRQGGAKMSARLSGEILADVQ